MRKHGQSTKFLMDCIAQSLLKLMKSHDYNSISISEICKHAGVGRTTFYRHFTESGGKDDVLVFYAASLWKDYSEANTELVRSDTWGALMNFIYDNREFFMCLGRAQLDHVLFSIFYKTMGPTAEDSPELGFVKSYLSGAVFGITYYWIQSGFTRSPSELAEGIARAIQNEQNNANDIT